MYHLLVFLAIATSFAISILMFRRHGVWSVCSFISLMFLFGFPVRAALALDMPVFRAFDFLTLEKSEIVKVCWIGVAGQIAFLLGTYSLPFARMPSRNGQSPSNHHQSRASTDRYLAFMCLLVAIISILFELGLMSFLFGSFQRAIISYTQRSMFNARSVGFMGTVSSETWQVTMPFLLASYYYAGRSRSKLAAFGSILLLLAVVPLYVIVNGRAAAVVVLWSGAMVATLKLGRRIGIGQVATGAVALAVFSVVGLAARTASQFHIPVEVAMTYVSDRIVLTISDALPMLDAYCAGENYVRLQGHSIFDVFVAPFTVLIPRDWWPSKPIFLPEIVNRVVLGFTGAGLPVGMMGEGFVAMGSGGLLVIPAVFGAFFARLERAISTWRGGDLLHCWLIFQACDLALNGVRVGVQSLLIGVQVALLFVAPTLLFQRFISDYQRKLSVVKI